MDGVHPYPCAVLNGGGVCCCPARSGGVVRSVCRLAWCVALSTAVMSCYCLVAVSCGVVRVSMSPGCSCGGVVFCPPPPHPSRGGGYRWVVGCGVVVGGMTGEGR